MRGCCLDTFHCTILRRWLEINASQVDESWWIVLLQMCCHWQRSSRLSLHVVRTVASTNSPATTDRACSCRNVVMEISTVLMAPMNTTVVIYSWLGGNTVCDLVALRSQALVFLCTTSYSDLGSVIGLGRSAKPPVPPGFGRSATLEDFEHLRKDIRRMAWRSWIWMRKQSHIGFQRCWRHDSIRYVDSFDVNKTAFL